MKNARIAALRAGFEAERGILTVRTPGGASAAEPVLEHAGRERMAAFLSAYLGDETRGSPRFHHVPGFVFGDQRRPVVSLINLASLAAFEAAAGAERHLMRFRANVYFTGVPWAEFDWVGREVLLGGVRARITKRTVRCPATEVNPATAERDAQPMAELRALYGHMDLGVHAEVVEGGRLALGDAVLPL